LGVLMVSAEWLCEVLEALVGVVDEFPSVLRRWADCGTTNFLLYAR